LAADVDSTVVHRVVPVVASSATRRASEPTTPAVITLPPTTIGWSTRPGRNAAVKTSFSDPTEDAVNPVSVGFQYVPPGP